MPHAVRFGGAAVSPSRPLAHAVMAVRGRGVRWCDHSGRLAGVVLVDVGALTLHRGRPKAHHAVMLNEPPGALVSGRNVPLLFGELVTPPIGSSSHGSSMRSGALTAPASCPIVVLLALYFVVVLLIGDPPRGPHRSATPT